METKYIVAIVAGSVFLVLFLIFIILSVQTRKKENLQLLRLEQMYADKNLVKMYYDFLVYDESTEEVVFTAQLERAGQTSFGADDSDDVPSSQGAMFQQVDADGLEEIVGTYKPD